MPGICRNIGQRRGRLTSSSWRRRTLIRVRSRRRCSCSSVSPAPPPPPRPPLEAPLRPLSLHAADSCVLGCLANRRLSLP